MFKFHYMRPSIEDKYGILQLQDKILEVMVYIDSFCKKHEIEYCLMGGSALGAKRHGGFIPWDDDLDIFMTPDNYEKFRDAFNRDGNKEKYYLQEWGLSEGMISLAKIRANGTSYIEESFKDWDIHHGIYVDIFILHICPDNHIERVHQYIWAKYILAKGLSLHEAGRHKGIKGLVIKIAGFFPERFLIKYAFKQVYKYRNRNTDYYCNYLGKAGYKKGTYRREWFDNPVYTQFETVQLKVPEKLHDFLTERFGNYMIAPDPERIKYEQHVDNWNLEQQMKITDYYYDEKNLI